MSFVKNAILLILLFPLSDRVLAQHQEISDHPEIWKGANTATTKDQVSILSAFKNGQVNGHFRFFSMATNNSGKLTDYYANAFGGGLKYETAPFHGFKFGLSGFYIFNVSSSDLTKPDSMTKQNNRYEISLFDITDPSNKNNIDRLEEFYLKYNFKKSQITLGKQLINTTFINLQDGRMRPTEVEGLWGEVHELNNTKIYGGYLHRISPRGTVEYYSIANSIGVYSSGVNEEGSPSSYKNQLSSKGILSLGFTNRSIPDLTIQASNLFVENIFNTSFLQADYNYELPNQSIITLGAQSIFQTAMNNGGNSNAVYAYLASNHKAFTYGAKLGWIDSRTEISLNYNRITAAGRYLMPREWGRDPFYTFMARERNEGFGDVHAVVLKYQYWIPKMRIKTIFSAGYFDLPNISNFKLNKYGLPSYSQFNLDIRYQFNGLLNGLDAQLLIAHKSNFQKSIPEKYIFNKVDMTNLNLILNFHF